MLSNASLDQNMLMDSSSKLSVTAGASLQLGGRFVIDPTAVLELVNVVSASTFVVVTAAAVDGQFGQVVVRSGVLADGCSASGSPTYSPGTLSVTTSISCSSDGLSTGAIVGIAVGAAVGGILLGILVVLLMRRLIGKRQKKMVEQIRASNMQLMKDEVRE